MSNLSDFSFLNPNPEIKFMPSKLIGSQHEYKECEGIEFESNYYHTLYESHIIDTTTEDYVLNIVQISISPTVEVNLGDDEYKIIRKVETRIYAYLMNQVEHHYRTYYLDDEFNEAIESETEIYY